MNQMQENENKTDDLIDSGYKIRKEPINQIHTDIAATFGWTSFISFRYLIAPSALAEEDSAPIPLAMTPIEEGQTNDIWAKGPQAAFYTRIAWLGYRGYHYENAMIFMRDYDKIYGIERHLRQRFQEDDLQSLDWMLEAVKVSSDWEKV